MLELKNVSKIFDKSTVNEKIALNDVNLTINDGDFVTVIGGNGAGKSTLLNLIAGTYFCDGGQILLDGQDIGKLKEYKRAKFLGRVFQDPTMGTAGEMEIEENLALAIRRGQRRSLKWGVTQSDRKLFKSALIKLNLGLDDRMTTKVKLLSGGQRQALTLLMATIKTPKLLLLDEHTAALDPSTAQKVNKLTTELTAEHHITTIMITHNMRDAIQYGNRLIMMQNGRIIYSAEGEEKQNLTTEILLTKFAEAGVCNDRIILG